MPIFKAYERWAVDLADMIILPKKRTLYKGDFIILP
jgi:hypothetical protein